MYVCMKDFKIGYIFACSENVCIYVYVCYVCMYIYMYVLSYVCMYVCAYRRCS